ncbi:Coproporphyrinogen III oxidase [Mycena floridula]|nr:Coproporphyrinogen III oxidase [Mycena floridula]
MTLMSTRSEQVLDYFRGLQSQVANALESIETGESPHFKIQSFIGPGSHGGHGQSMSLARSDDFESAHISTSISHRDHSLENLRLGNPWAAASLPCDLSTAAATTVGFTVSIKPQNPFAPSLDTCYHYIELNRRASHVESPVLWWFSGYSHLIPSYLFEQDAKHFHIALKGACDIHDSQLYPSFKRACDDYFYVTHLHEAIGIGGILFEHLYLDSNFDKTFSLVKSLGDVLVSSYTPILNRRLSTAYTLRERHWKLIRQGRYFEFGQLYQRRTGLGLTARIESQDEDEMEAVSRWEYRSDLEDDVESEEGKLMRVLRQPVEWYNWDATDN